MGIEIDRYFDSDVGTGNRTIGDYVGYFIEGAMVIGGVVFLYMIIKSGFLLIAHSGSAEELEKARKTLTTGLIGIIIIFASFWVIQLIESVTGSNFVTNPLSSCVPSGATCSVGDICCTAGYTCQSIGGSLRCVP